MGVVLRQNQKNVQDDAVNGWQRGARCVALVMGTGLGKTATMAKTAKDRCPGRGIVQAHRSELVGQLSLAWAREGIEHDLTVNPTVRRQIIDNHLDKLGRSYYRPDADWSVESVKTAVKREPKRAIDWVFQDEGHHVLRHNEWGKAINLYPGAKWLLPTATPGRADGMGLGAHADGHMNYMAVGPNLAEGMRDGFLVTYDILHAQAEDLDMTGVAIGANGEFNQSQVAKRVKQSRRIVGDAVETYLKHAYGRLCIVFAVDIEHAGKLHTEYIAKGVPAELVTGDDLDTVRLGALKRFEARETLVLINVDLFGEGTDVPGVEVVQMCRPTASFPLFCQMIGRMLRLDIDPLQMQMWDSFTPAMRLQLIAASRKPKALLIDHVGNIYREFKICDVTYSGPPEGFNAWSLDRRGRKSSAGGGIPQRTCLGCFQPYERIYDSCPYCGVEAPEPMVRGGPEQVDGDLRFYDPNLLAKIRAEVARIDGQFHAPPSLDPIAARAAHGHWHQRQKAQAELRHAIAIWAGKHHNASEDANRKRFFFTFGMDVPTACALGTADAEKLRAKIDLEILKP